MYCGLPVVATDNRGHVPIVRDGENGFLVHVNDVDRMAERLLEIAENPQLKKRLSGCDVSRYCAAAVSEQVYEILKQV